MADVVFPADGGPLTVTVWQADKNGNKIGQPLDPATFAVKITQDTGAATVAGNVVTPDPNDLADGETITLAYLLSANPQIAGGDTVQLTGEATQLVAEITQTAPAS